MNENNAWNIANYLLRSGQLDDMELKFSVASQMEAAYSGSKETICLSCYTKRSERDKMVIHANKERGSVMNEIKELADEAPLGYRLDHPMHGTEMSIHQPDDDWVNRGWVVTPLYASLVSSPLRSSTPQGDGRALRAALEEIVKLPLDAWAGEAGIIARKALSAPPSVAEALEDAAEWCAVRRAEIGAVDGYDYRSGEEFGLRRAEIELRRQAKETLTRPQPGGAVAGTERGTP